MKALILASASVFCLVFSAPYISAQGTRVTFVSSQTELSTAVSNKETISALAVSGTFFEQTTKENRQKVQELVRGIYNHSPCAIILAYGTPVKATTTHEIMGKQLWGGDSILFGLQESHYGKGGLTVTYPLYPPNKKIPANKLRKTIVDALTRFDRGSNRQGNNLTCF